MILSAGSKLNSCVFFYSDVKLWLSFRIYADSTFNSTYEEYKVRVANTDSALTTVRVREHASSSDFFESQVGYWIGWSSRLQIRFNQERSKKKIKTMSKIHCL